MNRLSLLILGILKHNKATSSVAALTLAEIIEIEDFNEKPNTVYKNLRDLELKLLVSNGLKDGKAKTYFITQEGVDYLEKVRTKIGG